MVVDTLHIIDIDGKQYSNDFINKISPFATYRDQVLREHLYDPATILELDEQEETENVFTIEEKRILEQLQQLMVEHSAAYCRFVFP